MRRSIFGIAGLIILGVLLIVGYSSIYVVDPTQQALVLRFGEPIRTTEEPGLYTKLPLIDNVVYIERRLLDLDSPPLEVIASDQKRLVVDAFARYRVTQPLLFYQTVGSVAVANSRLAVILNSAVRRVLGEASFTDVVRDRRAELMTRITGQVNTEAQRLGVEVVDVRILRADLPDANSQAVYQRMQTERQREATEIRAEGDEAARRLTAAADRDVTIIVAEANRQSQQLRGAGDREANGIYAQAYGLDPDFFSFYRSMQAYVDALQGNSTTYVISPDSDFFRWFNAFGTPSSLPVSREELEALLPDVPPLPEVPDIEEILNEGPVLDGLDLLSLPPAEVGIEPAPSPEPAGSPAAEPAPAEAAAPPAAEPAPAAEEPAAEEPAPAAPEAPAQP